MCVGVSEGDDEREYVYMYIYIQENDWRISEASKSIRLGSLIRFIIYAGSNSIVMIKCERFV